MSSDMDSDLMFTVKFILAVAVLVIVVFTIAIGAVVGLGTVTCGNLGRTTGYETQYDFLAGGCFIKIDGQWIPSSKWIYNNGN